MVLRTIEERDAPEIEILLQQLGYPSVNSELTKKKIKEYKSGNNVAFVAEERSKVIGLIIINIFSFFHKEGNIGRVSAICVEEKFRDKGIGKALLKEAEKFCLENGCKEIEITSRLKREKAHKFFLANGFIEESIKFAKKING